MNSPHPATQLLLATALIMLWLLPLSAWWMLRGWQDAGARLWFLGTAVYAMVATVFVGIRVEASAWHWIAIFSLSILSLLLMIEALRREIDTRAPRVAVYAVLLVAGILMPLVGIITFDDEQLARVVYLGYMGLLECWLIALAVRVKRRWGSRSLDVVILSFALFAVINFARTAEWLVSGQALPLISFTLLTNIAVVLNFVGVVFYSFGYWGFALEKSQRRAEESAQQALVAVERENEANYRVALAGEREALLSRMVDLGRLAQAGAVSASIAHEINQPLATVRLNLEAALAALDEGQEVARLRRLLDRAGAENLRAARIIERIRSLFQNRRSLPQPRSVDAVIERVVDLLRQNRKSAGVTIRTSLQAPEPIPMVDGELEHALINVVDNALDSVNAAGGASKSIDITTVQSGGKTSITIVDNGPGIAPELRERLFDLAISTKPNGMGMGLWLARYIVERQQGRLAVVERAEPGASFLIELPGPAARSDAA